MKEAFEFYKPRLIEFQKNISVNDWKVKVYSITNDVKFKSYDYLDKASKELHNWLPISNSSSLPTYKMAFLIIHEAREGVWALSSWWTGGEMVETSVYFAKYTLPIVFTNSPYSDNSLLCVWELEVFVHERKAWINHILLRADDPDFKSYFNDVLK